MLCGPAAPGQRRGRDRPRPQREDQDFNGKTQQMKPPRIQKKGGLSPGSTIMGRFRKNWVGFCASYKWLTAVFLVALLCDALSTTYFMLGREAAEELHPVVGFAAEILGPVLGPLVGFAGKATAGLCVAVYCRRWARHILGATTVIALWAAWYNIWGVDLYYPNLLRLIPW